MSDDDVLPGGVRLAEAIKALRAELIEATTTENTSGLRFKPGPVELTVEAGLTKNVGGNTGIKWWLVEAGVEASRQSMVMQTLRITLQPVVTDSEGRIVDALISGAEDPSDRDLSREDQTADGKE